MDFNTAHDIIHESAKNQSKYCSVCNGDLKGDDVQKEAGNIIKQQRDQRNNMHIWGGDKKTSDTKASDKAPIFHKKTVYPLVEIVAGEKGKLPDEIQLMPIGKWDTVPYDEIEITASDLQEMKKNFDSGHRAGVPIDVDHDGKAAAGWIESVRVADDGLWGSVTWTDLGKKLLGERQYRFLSPEFNPEYTNPENKNEQLKNVLIAASLVNRPLFKELKPLVASDHLTRKNSGVMLFIESMNVEELLKKKKAGEPLTASEKAFLASYIFDDENKGDRKGDADSEGDKFKKSDKAKPGDKSKEMDEGDEGDEGKDDGDEDDKKVKASKKASDQVNGKTQVSISAAEYSTLKANADRGVEAAEKLEAKEIEDTIESWMFSETGGYFAPVIKDDLTAFYKTLSKTQRKTFGELVEKMPQQKNLFTEFGSSEDLTKGGAADTLTVKAKELMSESKKNGKTLTFSAAVKQAIRENPALGDYNLVAIKGKVVTK